MAILESFVEGKTVNAVGFSHNLGKLKNLPIANVVYAYDFSDGRTVLIENFNAIYLGESMEDSLVNPIQCEDNGVHIDLRPKRFYPQLEDECQHILFHDGIRIPLEFDGVLPCIFVRRPTHNELHNCQRIQLTSEAEWDPRTIHGITTKLHQELKLPPPVDNIDDNLTFSNIAALLASQPLMHAKNDEYFSAQAINTQRRRALTPEDLSKLWKIGLATATRTLKATTHKCI